MPIRDYLSPENGGAQMWQMLASNLTRGTHPYNFSGFCMALVVQWLMEIRFEGGQSPEELGRHLLRGALGTHGYGGIASSQDRYGLHAPHMANIHDAMVHGHSGGALARQNEVTVQSANDHWGEIRSRVYGVPNDDIIRFYARSRVYYAHVSLAGNNSWLTSWFAGATWGHAIGLYSNQDRVYFFDPNYGVFVFDQRYQGRIAQFIETLWQDYGAGWGRVADVT